MNNSTIDWIKQDETIQGLEKIRNDLSMYIQSYYNRLPAIMAEIKDWIGKDRFLIPSDISLFDGLNYELTFPGKSFTVTISFKAYAEMEEEQPDPMVPPHVRILSHWVKVHEVRIFPINDIIEVDAPDLVAEIKTQFEKAKLNTRY